MDLAAHLRTRFDAHLEVHRQAAEVLAAPIALAAERLTRCLMEDRKVLACGNGGSAAEAQRFCSEMVNRFEVRRPGLAALSLNADTVVLTSVANDHGFAEIYARQVRALGRQADVLVVLSTSGNSESLVEAVHAAHERDLGVVALTGRDGGALALALGPEDVEIRVPADSTPRIQEVHLLAVHCLCDLIDRLLLGLEA